MYVNVTLLSRFKIKKIFFRKNLSVIIKRKLSKRDFRKKKIIIKLNNEIFFKLVTIFNWHWCFFLIKILRYHRHNCYY